MTKKEMKQQTERTISLLFRGYEVALSDSQLHHVYSYVLGTLNTLWNLELITDNQFDTLSERNYNLFIKTGIKIGAVKENV